MTRQPFRPGEASGDRAVAVGHNQGIVSTGDGAVIDNRTVRLPAEAVRGPAEVAAPPGLNNLPAPRSGVFVGREEDLARLDAATGIEDGHEADGAVPVVVHGLGGMGKSTLALHYAHRHRDRYNPVWWIPAESAATIGLGLAALAAHLNPYADLTAASGAEAAAWATTWLQAHDGWLLVFDDAAVPGDLAPLLGSLTTGRHLITSRRATGWHHLARPVTLDTLTPDAALDLLMRITDSTDDGAAPELAELAAELGHLPLALEQAAAYIQHTALTPAAYLARLRRHPARMFATTASASADSGQQRTIARIWQLTLDAIAARDPLAVEILRTAAWFGPDDVPRDLAEALDDDPIAVDEALALLHAYSMITLTPRTFAVHRLVQAVARTPDPADPHRGADAIDGARRRAAELLAAALPEDPLFNVAGWPRWRELLPHIEAYAALTEPTAPDQDDEAIDRVLFEASAFLLGEGRTDRAVAFAERSVAASERLRGPDHPRTLSSRSYLASACRSAGDLDRATPLHERNLADCERVLGPDHPDTLASRSNLAHLYALTGDPDRAAPLHERNLADYERTLGADHPHTLASRANLATVHRSAGDLDRALPLLTRNLADHERVLGPDHPETLTARSNLAYAYELAGDPDRAVPLHERVLADRERVLGAAHPHTELARDLLTRARAARP
ncbi:tetratricopeptide repeat protein [Streptomyces sp. NBS 14/10]|uniref:tetratricopeptide repeat protein n=1 Tax=Streptomyces sp. NBS 14/10 TaxID=1945643 RepID=UPI000B7F92B8|nr:tetratricopeptide repeat protein [Streptomyces sp. NBS 14/10]KAK1181717.1 tetratricopeptide repeat protein [Streptomyces sp. NBS 14/10]